MTAILLALGVTAHAWALLLCAAYVHADRRDKGPAAGFAAMLAFPGLTGVVYFWARVGGLA